MNALAAALTDRLVQRWGRKPICDRPAELRRRQGYCPRRPRGRRPRADRRRLGARPAAAAATSKDIDLEVFGVAGRSAARAARIVRPRRNGRRELPGLQGRRDRRLAAAPRFEVRPRAPRLRRRPAIRRCRSRTRPGAATSPINAISWDPLTGRVPRSVRRPRRSRAAACCASSIRGRSATTACACCARCSSPRGSSSTLDDDDARPVPDDSARRSAGRAHLGRDREAAAPRRARRSASRSRSTSASSTQLFPELQALVGCPQEPEWHPEGDVWVHTLQVVDQARTRIDDLDRAAADRGHARRGLPRLRQAGDDGVHRRPHPIDRSRGAGRRAGDGVSRSAERPLDRRLRRPPRRCSASSAQHLKPGMWFKVRDEVGDGAFRRLAQKVDLELLARLAKADCLGREPGRLRLRRRWTGSSSARGSSASSTARRRRSCSAGTCWRWACKPGPRVGEILKAVYEQQLDGERGRRLRRERDRSGKGARRCGIQTENTERATVPQSGVTTNCLKLQILKL